MSPSFRIPPRLTNDRGEERRVGMEVEFGRLERTSAATAVQRIFGGTIEECGRFLHLVRGGAWGDWEVSFDSHILQEAKWRRLFEHLHAPRGLTDLVEDALAATLGQWVPNEIVSPPIPLSELAKTDELLAALGDLRASGTHASSLYMFGFQLNPELPALDAPTIARYLRAFLALYDWLHAAVDVDPTRKWMSFVDPFPAEYKRRILAAEDHEPTMARLIDEYLEFNPTRNRALDLLPLFAHIDRERVLARAKEPDQIKPRPTFHYRMPNSLVDEPDWSFALEWNRWVEVERLAEDPVRLRKVAAIAAEPPLEMDRDGWLRWGKLLGVVSE